jgi:hypothetical protein
MPFPLVLRRLLADRKLFERIEASYESRDARPKEELCLVLEKAAGFKAVPEK